MQLFQKKIPVETKNINEVEYFLCLRVNDLSKHTYVDTQ